MQQEFEIIGEYIQLDQLLKALAWVDGGGAAHQRVAEGLVKVNGNIELRKRAKLRAGDRVLYAQNKVLLVAGQPQ